MHSVGMDGAVSNWNNKEEVQEMLEEKGMKSERVAKASVVLKEGWGLKKFFTVFMLHDITYTLNVIYNTHK